MSLGQGSALTQAVVALKSPSPVLVTVSRLRSYFSFKPLYALLASAQACSALAGSGCAAVQMTKAGRSQNSGLGAKRPPELPAAVPRVFKKDCTCRQR